MCSRWDSLHACASVSPVKKRSKETEEVEEEDFPNELTSLIQDEAGKSRSRGVYYTSPTCLGTKVAEPAVGLPNVVV